MLPTQSEIRSIPPPPHKGHFFLALEAEGGVSQCSHPSLGAPTPIMVCTGKALYMLFNNLFDELGLQNWGGGGC